MSQEIDTGGHNASLTVSQESESEEGDAANSFVGVDEAVTGEKTEKISK